MRLTITLPDGAICVFEDDNPAAVGVALAVFERQRRPYEQRQARRYPPPGNPWENFITRLRDKPRLMPILRAIKDSGQEGIERRQLAEALQLRNTRELGGRVGSLRRTTLRSGFELLDDVILVRGSRYVPGRILRENDLPS